jgi:hypothetical protein
VTEPSGESGVRLPADERRPWDPVIPRVVAALLGIFAVLDIVLAVQLATGQVVWDVKGYVLRGGELALFTSAVAAVGLVGTTSAAGIWMGRDWGRWGALVFWLMVGLVSVTTDRSVAGPGEPLHVYFVYMMLLPGAITGALLWLVPPSRRFFRR